MYIETLDQPDLAGNDTGDLAPFPSDELVHRYLFARRFAQGRSVLDISSDSRHASPLLSQTSRSVRTVSKENLKEEVGRFQLVLDFDGAHSCGDLNHVLAPSAIVIMSVNAEQISEAVHQVQTSFRYIRALQQRRLRGSLIVDVEPHMSAMPIEVFAGRDDSGPYRRRSGDLDASSVLILASDEPLPELGISLLDQSTGKRTGDEAFDLHARIADLEARLQDLRVQRELAIIQAEFLRKKLTEQREEETL